MNYTWYELICSFFVYAFLGWCLEVVYAAVGKRKFVNRGLLNGVLCPVYGLSAVFLLVFFESLKGNVISLFLACLVVTTVSEFLTGTMMEKIFGQKCWDYTKFPLHIGNYVCLRFSLLWAALSLLILYILQPFMISLVQMIPILIGKIILIVFGVLLLIDMVTTVAAVRKLRIENKQLQEIADGIKQVSSSLGNAITVKIHRRMKKAYPNLGETQEDLERKEQEAAARKTIFAYGCSFYKLVWLFLLGSFLGDITETIFCVFAMGKLMSRSSVVYGPFSIVWGIGVVFLTILLHKFSNKNDRYIFISGTVLGGVYEYICSVFTEIAFGTVFWDYSDIPFNLGGRVNLLYCFFWGFAAIIWIKGIYPFLSKWIEKIPMTAGKIISWLFLIFMAFNIIMSALALARYTGRSSGYPAQNNVEEFMDDHFHDKRMEQIYPNAILK